MNGYLGAVIQVDGVCEPILAGFFVNYWYILAVTIAVYEVHA